MSQTAFSTVATNTLAAQPTASALIYVRSNNVADAGTLTVYGDVSATPDSDALTLNGKVEVSSVEIFDSISQAILSTAQAGVVKAYGPGTAASGDIRTDTNPTDADTLTIGGIVYRFKTTMAAINDVQLGSTATDTTLAIKKAINLDGIAGTDYFTGTAANPIYSATVATTVITLTDRIPCERRVDQTITESASNFAIRLPIGGVDGTLLFTLAAGILSAADVLTFSTEDHSTATLPALMLGTSNSVNVQGNQAMLRLWSDNGISYKVQSSTDNLTWTDTSEGIAALPASTLTYVTLAELAEFIRFVITTNANTGDSIADFRVIY
tara:strand:+ start:8609 stop:9583 length:975 start_codon:yes stop_codon:yes gene_type:complete